MNIKNIIFVIGKIFLGICLCVLPSLFFTFKNFDLDSLSITRKIFFSEKNVEKSLKNSRTDIVLDASIANQFDKRKNLPSKTISLSGDRPMTRVLVGYIPYIEANLASMLSEAFGFTEAWKTVYHKNSWSQLIEKGTIDETQFSWLETQRSKLYSFHLEDLNTTNIKSVDAKNSLIEPAGPPLITDVIFVTSPEYEDAMNFHPACKILDSLDTENETVNLKSLLSRINLEERLKAAQLLLQSRFNKTLSYAERREEALLGDSQCFYLKAPILTTSIDVLKQHPATNSIGCLISEPMSSIVAQYDLTLRTDLDCFVTPYFNDPRLIPWKLDNLYEENNLTKSTLKMTPFLTGGGGYSGEQQNEIIALYAKLFGLRYQEIHSVGSTWYGDSRDILRAAKLSTAITVSLLKNDAVFRFHKTGGIWPHWYKGVTTMYAGELAVNNLIETSRLFLMRGIIDGESIINETLSAEKPIIHIHLWHTDAFFSKFHHYPSDLVLSEDANILYPSWYSFFHKTAGDLLHEIQRKKFNSQNPFSSIPLDELVTLQTDYFRCPKEFPFPYHEGIFCCASSLDCDEKPLFSNSTCCDRHDYTPCPSSRGCLWTGLSRSPTELEGTKQKIQLSFKTFLQKIRYRK